MLFKPICKLSTLLYRDITLYFGKSRVAVGCCLELYSKSNLMISQVILSRVSEMYVSLALIKNIDTVKRPRPKFISIMTIFFSFISCLIVYSPFLYAMNNSITFSLYLTPPATLTRCSVSHLFFFEMMPDKLFSSKAKRRSRNVCWSLAT